MEERRRREADDARDGLAVDEGVGPDERVAERSRRAGPSTPRGRSRTASVPSAHRVLVERRRTRRGRPGVPRTSPRSRHGAPCGRCADDVRRSLRRSRRGSGRSTRQPIEWPMCSRCQRPSASRWFASAGWKRAKVATTPTFAAPALVRLEEVLDRRRRARRQRPAVAHRRPDVGVAGRSVADQDGEDDVSRGGSEVQVGRIPLAEQARALEICAPEVDVAEPEPVEERVPLPARDLGDLSHRRPCGPRRRRPPERPRPRSWPARCSSCPRRARGRSGRPARR